MRRQRHEHSGKSHRRRRYFVEDHHLLFDMFSHLGRGVSAILYDMMEYTSDGLQVANTRGAWAQVAQPQPPNLAHQVLFFRLGQKIWYIVHRGQIRRNSSFVRHVKVLALNARTRAQIPLWEFLPYCILPRYRAHHASITEWHTVKQFVIGQK